MTFPPYYFILIIAIIAMALFLSSKLKPKFDYAKNKSLMTEREQEFYWRLVQAYPALIVCPQVQLARLITAKGAGQKKQKGFWRIAALSCDFVICDRSGRPLVVLEIDDSSHKRKAQVYRDRKKDEALNSAGLPIHRLTATNIPSVNELHVLLTQQNDQARPHSSNQSIAN